MKKILFSLICLLGVLGIANAKETDAISRAATSDEVQYSTDAWKSQTATTYSYDSSSGEYTISKWMGTKNYNLKFTVDADNKVTIKGYDPYGFGKTNYVDGSKGKPYYIDSKSAVFVGDETSAYGKFSIENETSKLSYEFIWGGHEIPSGPGEGGGETGPDADDELMRLDAWAIDMVDAHNTDATSLRSIKYAYNLNTKVYTFYGLIEGEAKVKFHIENAMSKVNNIAFDNGVPADEYAFTYLMPDKDGNNTILVAKSGHQDWGSPLSSYNTKYLEDTNDGMLLVLDGSRSKIKRAIKFGTGTYHAETIGEVPDIASFKAVAKRSKLDVGQDAEDIAKVYKITGPVTCVVDYEPKNSWYYVQDATGTLGIYVNMSFPLGEKQAYSAGDVLQGITGFSVGSEADGYQMEVDDVRFYVYDEPNHDASKEYTMFPAVSGTATVSAPKEINTASEITSVMNHEYVVLKGWRYQAEKTVVGDQAPARLYDAAGQSLDLSWDLVEKTADDQEGTNAFLSQVKNGDTGDFVGFISNYTKNFVVSSWNLGASAIEGITSEPKNPAKTIYNAAGQHLSHPLPGLNIINGKKVLY